MAKQPTSVLLLLAVAALLHHLPAGDAQITTACGKSDITFVVTATGNVVGGQKEYEVEIGTSCPCPTNGVHVWCGGLEISTVPLDPSKVEVDEGMCVLKVPIAKGSPLVFTYSSEVPVNFRVFGGANTAC